MPYNGIMRLKRSFRDKKLIVFDLDGTLTESKSEIKPDMSGLLCKLLKTKPIAIIGGGKYQLFRTQFIAKFKCPKELFHNLFLFPTTSTSFYCYQNGWKKVYAKELSKREKKKIKKAFQEAFKEINYIKPKKTYGKVIEDRGTQITFSALGQEVVKVLGEKGIQLKTKWRDENTGVKLKLAEALQRRLPDMEVVAAGYTSIDVVRKGVDKAYGLRQIEKNIHVSLRDMLFVGDALFPGGNDYAARKTGVDCISVSGPKETKKFIRFLLKKQ